MPAYKFYNIGKANAEIDRLEARVTELEGEAKKAKDSGTANADADKKHAEEIKQLTDGHAQAMEAAAKELTDAKSAHAKEIETAKADHAKAIAAKDEEVKVAQKAGVNQLSKTGHTAVKAETTTTEKTGGAKTREDLIAEYNAMEDPKAKGEFYEAHKKEMFGR
jgi:chromosome segregation ATPase